MHVLYCSYFSFLALKGGTRTDYLATPVSMYVRQFDLANVGTNFGAAFETTFDILEGESSICAIYFVVFFFFLSSSRQGESDRVRSARIIFLKFSGKTSCNRDFAIALVLRSWRFAASICRERFPLWGDIA